MAPNPNLNSGPDRASSRWRERLPSAAFWLQSAACAVVGWTLWHGGLSNPAAGASDGAATSPTQAANPAAYLYACVKHCAMDWQRSRRRQSRREVAAARPEADSLFAGPLEQDDRRAAITAALRTLPENQREVLVMKIWGGLSFPQIALVLRVSANTAASRYRYALAKLREQLAEESIS